MLSLPLDLRSLAVLRVAVALCVACDVLERADSIELYLSGPPGSCVLPPRQTPHHLWLHRLWFSRGPWALQVALFAGCAASAASLAVGHRPRASAALAWLLLVGIQGRNECVNDGSDRLLRNVLLWCIFLPLSGPPCSDGGTGAAGTTASAATAAATTAAAAATTSGSAAAVAAPTAATAATAGLTLQVVGMYAALIVQRWGQAAWWTELSAVHYALVSPFAVSTLGKHVAQLPALARAATSAAIATEALVPPLLLVTPATHMLRLLPVLVLGAMHLGVGAMLRLPGFTRIAALVMVAFVPSRAWDAAGWPADATPRLAQAKAPRGMPPRYVRLLGRWRRLPRRAASAATAIVAAAAAAATAPTAAGAVVALAAAAAAATAATAAAAGARSTSAARRPGAAAARLERAFVVAPRLLLGYMLYLLVAEAGLLRKVDGGDVGEFLRFSQDWRMYSPQPPRDGGWWAVRGRWNHTAVDVLRGARHGAWLPEAVAAAAAVPRVPSLLYRSWRWERYMSNLGKTAGKTEWLPRDGPARFVEGPLRGRRGCAAGDSFEATERLVWLGAHLCSQWAASGRAVDGAATHPASHPASRGGGAVLEMDWFYVRLPPPGVVASPPSRSRELTYAC